MNPPLPLEEAQSRLIDAASPLATERVAIENAIGRFLAEPLVANRTQPWADLSAMDGFATSGPGPWRIVGESAAGHPFARAMANGEAARISTGAAVPDGADAILLVEDTAIDGAMVSAAAPPSAKHIRRRGFDFRSGDELLSAGVRIGPAQLALGLAAGIEHCAVRRRPRVAILDTGDELATSLDDPRPDALPASNGPMLAAMIAGLADAERVGPVPDDHAKLLAAFENASDADVIVTTGGASVGEHDLVRPVLEDWGARIDFWRVAIRPGKPLMIGRRGSQWIVGLPGNPASAFVTAFLFVLPVLRRLGGASADEASPKALPAILADGVPAGGRRREFLRGIRKGATVVPIAERDSSALRALAAADCLIDRPANADALTAGAPVAVYPLDA
ncbi:molybdopterin molybdotransferase MoeA [Tsuneonella amylolytica]|uniref:molybdopterin molybdotransferase MoeA n=1 Tax=Tsuneonella amylolytica TaxID=2338327 RepID=UPI000EA8EBA4|nr:molybdopterin molybdotransferase MoeA [Tsuneonella amylolytica]